MTRVTILVLAVGAALFHLYSAGVTPFTALVQRPIHLAFMASLGFLGLGVRRLTGGAEDLAESPGKILLGWVWMN